MIQQLHLKNFKNFQDATLQLGPFTVLIGANASGKSNIRDAFRFLHGVGRGYSLAEILGEKYNGGDRIWAGIRGGLREVAYAGTDSFRLEATLDVIEASKVNPSIVFHLNYSIEVQPGDFADRGPQIRLESLVREKPDRKYFQSGIPYEQTGDGDSHGVDFFRKSQNGKTLIHKAYKHHISILGQIMRDTRWPEIYTAYRRSRQVVRKLDSFRFLDLSPTQMRIPSLPGQTALGDRGENLSSVLLAICEDAPKKEALLEWVRKLTPMDVEDFDFDQDAAGKVLLKLKERSGRSVSALSASDGTLRFLAILAALFGPAPASFYFIEELENGIHPTRLGLLVDLIETQTRLRKIQVVATCHSPLLLQFLSEEALENASIVYRLPDRPDAKIRRILDIPEAARVIKEQGVALLHASSWFEDVMNFSEDEESASDDEAHVSVADHP